MKFNELTDEEVRSGVGKIRVKGFTGNFGTLIEVDESDDFTVVFRWDDPAIPDSIGYKMHVRIEVLPKEV